MIHEMSSNNQLPLWLTSFISSFNLHNCEGAERDLLLFQVQAVLAIRASSMYGTSKNELITNCLFEEQGTHFGSEWFHIVPQFLKQMRAENSFFEAGYIILTPTFF